MLHFQCSRFFSNEIQGRRASLRSALAPGYLISRLRRSGNSALLSCTSELNPPNYISVYEHDFA